MSEMNKAERLELTKIVRARARIAKDDVNARQAQILADAEAALAKRFNEDDAAWKELTAEARQYMAEVQAKIEAKCAELGVPATFRPYAFMSWLSRGENADPKRRAELRKVVQAQAEASARAARLEIDRQSVGFQEQLMAGSLESDAAKAFLESLPTPEELMPALSMDVLEIGDGQ